MVPKSFRINAPWIALSLVCAFAIACGLTIAANQYRTVYDDYAAKQAYADAEQKHFDECFGVTDKEQFRRCVGDAVQSARAPQRSEEDVSAQKEMALWAKWMLVATAAIGLLSLLATIVGAVFVWQTLYETRRIGQAQTRAYLAVKGGKYEIHGTHFIATLKVRNYGVSTAKNVTVIPSFERDLVSEANVFRRETVSFADKPRDYGNWQAGFDGSLRIIVDDANDSWQRLAGAIERNSFFYLRVSVFWEDVFGNRDSVYADMIGSWTESDMSGDDGGSVTYGRLRLTGRALQAPAT